MKNLILSCCSLVLGAGFLMGADQAFACESWVVYEEGQDVCFDSAEVIADTVGLAYQMMAEDPQNPDNNLSKNNQSGSVSFVNFTPATGPKSDVGFTRVRSFCSGTCRGGYLR